MSAISIQQILDYTNQARTNPKKFSQYIKKQINSFINNKSLPLLSNCTYSTNQGKQAWIQAYQCLNNLKPLYPLKLNEGLNLAAMDHALDMKNNHFFDHSSSNGMQFSQRIQRRCGKSYGGCAENLGNQFDIAGRNHALQTVLGLIIDDGVPSRGHRKSMLSDKYRYVGIYSVKSDDKIYTCMDFHTQDLKTIDSSQNISQQKPQNYKLNNIGLDKYTNMKGNFTPSNNQKSFGFNFNNNLVSQGENNGQKYVASKSTSTKTSTVNGKTKKIVTTKIKYSDGSTQEIVEESNY